MFNEPAINWFSEELCIERNGISSGKIINEVEMEGDLLKDRFADHLPKDQHAIYYLTVNV